MGAENVAASTRRGSNIELSTLCVNETSATDPVSHVPLNSNLPPESTQRSTQARLKLISSSFSFFCAGVNDGSLGTLIPYLLQAYNIITGFIAIVYASAFAGWLLAAAINSHVSGYLDMGAVLAIGAVLQLFAQILRAWDPPYALFAITFFLAGLGTALQDSHANTYVSSIKGAHRWLGFIHAMYGLGCTVSSFVVTAVATANMPSRWNLFYLFPLGLGLANLVLVLVAFRKSVGRMKSDARPEEDVQSRNKKAVAEVHEISKLKAVWLLSMFFFFYLGVSITAGGWILEYLVRVRDGDLSKIGYVPTGFYGGITLGRLLLAEPTHRFGERRMTLSYIVICTGLQIVFWLVPSVIADAVALSLFGFFLGPWFATGISIGSKLFPKKVQSSSLALVFVLAQAGGSLFPSLTGLIALRSGVQVLQPVLVGLLVATGISWVLVPRVHDRRE